MCGVPNISESTDISRLLFSISSKIDKTAANETITIRDGL